ncbi:hypothetical protein [Arsenicicoccus dermatophilus]|uniref:hypothetical protein n=1 Tax=Arsenicicoccus dermatophilus TaxID=1076331 RepID=UPI001F4CC03C|nr:hypothetical protein [Arsenicicoccus dermatophilus]MCH8611724.1 hypothetical protein [Arsenicicoccus dermatophilus]
MAGNAVTRYLASRKNITGTVLAAGTAAATVPTHLAGDWWPAAVVGVYALGAAVMPEPRSMRTGTQGTQQLVAGLRTDLQRLVDSTDRAANRMPAEGYQAFRDTVDDLRDVLARPARLAVSPDDLHVVERTVHDYLPTTIEGYLHLPADRLTVPGPEGRTADQELVHQLGAVRERVAGVRRSLVAGDAQTLSDQGRFLDERLGG